MESILLTVVILFTAAVAAAAVVAVAVVVVTAGEEAGWGAAIGVSKPGSRWCSVTGVVVVADQLMSPRHLRCQGSYFGNTEEQRLCESHLSGRGGTAMLGRGCVGVFFFWLPTHGRQVTYTSAIMAGKATVMALLSSMARPPTGVASSISVIVAPPPLLLLLVLPTLRLLFIFLLRPVRIIS